MQVPTDASRTVLDPSYPRAQEHLPADQASGGRYLVRFARNAEDLAAV